ncbi:uncharacterized protein METZ01_LOCUS288543, partial [marine metagenome]
MSLENYGSSDYGYSNSHTKLTVPLSPSSFVK